MRQLRIETKPAARSVSALMPKKAGHSGKSRVRRCDCQSDCKGKTADANCKHGFRKKIGEGRDRDGVSSRIRGQLAR